jgi:hypothetical protein
LSSLHVCPNEFLQSRANASLNKKEAAKLDLVEEDNRNRKLLSDDDSEKLKLLTEEDIMNEVEVLQTEKNKIKNKLKKLEDQIVLLQTIIKEKKIKNLTEETLKAKQTRTWQACFFLVVALVLAIFIPNLSGYSDQLSAQKLTLELPLDILESIAVPGSLTRLQTEAWTKEDRHPTQARTFLFLCKSSASCSHHSKSLSAAFPMAVDLKKSNADTAVDSMFSTISREKKGLFVVNDFTKLSPQVILPFLEMLHTGGTLSFQRHHVSTVSSAFVFFAVVEDLSSCKVCTSFLNIENCLLLCPN